MKFLEMIKRYHYKDLKRSTKYFTLFVLNKVSDCIQTYRLNTNHPFAFVCGCSHSGTTLLASIIGNHSSVFLLPRETYAFAQPKALSCSASIAKDWASITLSLNKEITVEKTPKHCHSIERIKKTIPNSRFILITRNPLDNIASLYERNRSLEQSIAQYNAYNQKIINKTNDSSCLIIKYEDLIREPSQVTDKVHIFLGLSCSKDVSGEGISFPYGHRTLTALEEKRAEQVSQPITKNINSWKKRISEKQAMLIIKRTRKIANRLGYSSYLSLGEF